VLVLLSFLTHQNQLYLKTRCPLLPPQQRRATHRQMAQNILTGVWVKTSIRLVGLHKNEMEPKKKRES